MRKANTSDLFNVARLINSLDLKEDLFNAQKGNEDFEKIGFDFIFNIFSKATTKQAEKQIYECLANPFEMKPEEVGQLDITTLIDSFTQCFDLTTLINFIKRAIPKD